MKTLSLSLAFLAEVLLSPGCADSPPALQPDADQAGNRVVTWTGQDGQEYGLYLPTAPAGTRLPVVMYLHGYTGDPIGSPPWFIEPLNRIEPCAVFLPTRPASEGSSAWGGTYDDALRPGMVAALAELDNLLLARNLDPNRQYVYGDSMGGEGVFKLLVEFPDRFAGAIAVAGYTLDVGADLMVRTALWILHGSDDTVNPTSSSQTIYQSILAAGGTRVKYTEYPGLDHESIWAKVPTEPGLCDWLLAQRHPQ